MPRWVYSVLPVSLASGPLSTLIQLHLIQLNGPTLGVIYAGLAVSAFNGVSIPAAMFWGYATDQLHSRRSLIVASYFVQGLILLVFGLINSTTGTMLIYSVFAFVSSAAATPLNLLIMESEPKTAWASAFARLSMMLGIGVVAGLILSTVWVQALPIVLLSIPLGNLAVISAVIALITVRDPSLILEEETIVRRAPSFFARLLSLPLFFINIPRPTDFRRVFRGLRYELTSYVPLFYISTVLFYFSSGIFNTSFVPALSNFSLSAGEIFAVILTGMVVQTLAFPYAGGYIARRSLVAASVQGLLLRGGCYLLLGVSAVVVAGAKFILPALVLYPLGAGVAYVAYYTSSNTMMFNMVQGRNPGSTLGVYSAVVGFATLSGSLISGFVSVYAGFDVTFISAAVLLLAAASVVSRLPFRSEQSPTTSAGK
jgi:MFS family permease